MDEIQDQGDPKSVALQKAPKVELKRLTSGFFNVGDVRKKLAFLKIFSESPYTSLRAAAGLLNISRNTAAAWYRNVEFQKILTEKIDVVKLSTRMKREAETSAMADMTAGIALKRLEAISKRPTADAEGGPIAAKGGKEYIDATTALLKEYRFLRDEERKDAGEANWRGEKHVTVEGQVNVNKTESGRQTLVAFVQQNFPQARVSPGMDPQRAIIEIGTRALLETDLADKLCEEDRVLEEAELANAPRKR
jgi:hypothetical protein